MKARLMMLTDLNPTGPATAQVDLRKAMPVQTYDNGADYAFLEVGDSLIKDGITFQIVHKKWEETDGVLMMTLYSLRKSPLMLNASGPLPPPPGRG